MEKYTIIENDIIECINSGKLKNGEKIPSESELCEKYKVSRTTVRKALANLSTNGKIIRKIGDGSYVNDQVFVNNTGRALSFTEDMEKTKQDIQFSNNIREQTLLGLNLAKIKPTKRLAKESPK